MTRLPSIRARLARALLGWSLVGGVAVAAAVWLVVHHEVDQLLDDTLQASAEVLAVLLTNGEITTADRWDLAAPASADGTGERFAWQVVGPAGQLLLRSPHAPAAPLHAAVAAGFGQTPHWRTFGMRLGQDRRMLYVAQTRAERGETQAEVALSSALAALAIGLLGHLWLRARIRHELMPLQALSQRLAEHEPLEGGAALGAAERAELAPMQSAIEALGQRLARRIAHERAFTAHAAHSLRTPLAGIDAQLAMALRECPPALQPRLQRVRDAATRLQRVVRALLALFRSGAELRREPVDVAALVARLPVDGLTVEVPTPSRLEADADLLAAALLNLMDNSLRCGARRVLVTVPRPQTVLLHDDGPGVALERRGELQSALDQQAYESRMGLGLMLADLVARAHGGALVLPEVSSGFAAELRLGENDARP